MGREHHHPIRCERFADRRPRRIGSDPGRSDGASAEDAGRQGALRPAQAHPEPVFGIIKSVLGFRQFSLRGLDKVHGEWTLVTMAWNVKRMFVLNPA